MLGSGSARGAHYGRLWVSASAEELGSRLGGRCRMCAELARGQIRGRAVGEVGLADLCRDVDAVVRRERAEALRALAPDTRLRVDQDRGRPGLLVRAAVPIGALDHE